MLKKFILGISSLALALFAGQVRAEEASQLSLKMGADVRVRSETLANFDSFTPNRTVQAGDSFILLRARTYIDASPMSQLRLFVQPQFSRNFAQDEATLANGQNIDDFDLHQGFVDFTKLLNEKLSVRVGRQELSYGDERLIGALDWSNTGRNFDATRITYTLREGWVDAFGSWIQRAGGNQYLSGLYGHWDATETIDEEPYVLWLHDNDAGVGTAELSVVTIGNRLVGTAAKNWDYGLEGAVQVGKSGTLDVLAGAVHARGGYTFNNVAWKPRIGLEYNFASGDSSPNAGSKVTTFNNLFPTNHNKYGYMDLVGLRNIHDPALMLQADPLKSVSLGLGVHAFLLPEVGDGLYQATGAQLRAGAAGASRYVGSEIDTTISYKWNQYAKFLVGYSFFKAGDFLADTGVKEDAHFAYLQTQIKFDATLK